MTANLTELTAALRALMEKAENAPRHGIRWAAVIRGNEAEFSTVRPDGGDMGWTFTAQGASTYRDDDAERARLDAIFADDIKIAIAAVNALPRLLVAAEDAGRLRKALATLVKHSEDHVRGDEPPALIEARAALAGAPADTQARRIPA